MKLLTLILSLLLVFSSCERVHDTIDPQISYSVPEKYLRSLSTPFEPLTNEELSSVWGQEFVIAQAFASQLDLYRAITTYKRAQFLIPQSNQVRIREIQYKIILCYFLGKRFSEVTSEFERSSLYSVSKDFPAYHDLLVVLYDSYLETNELEKASYIEELIKYNYPDTNQSLEVSRSLTIGDTPSLKKIHSGSKYKGDIQLLLSEYEKNKKSPGKAQILNAILPGAGYLYVGQKQSAVTSLLLNGLFIWAATHFFYHNHLAAGIITTSFEAGWYFGGIYGAGESAKLFNERLFESYAHNHMVKNSLFTPLMLRYGF